MPSGFFAGSSPAAGSLMRMKGPHAHDYTEKGDYEEFQMLPQNLE
jgi:hypothetical protein